MSNLKVVPWRQPEEVDEPEFGDGDGGGGRTRMYCPDCGFRFFVLLDDNSTECGNCETPVAIRWEETDG